MTDATRLQHPLLDQVSAYEAMREDLGRESPDRWVIISGGRLVGDYISFQEADEAATRMGLVKTECLFKPVGVETVIISTGARSR